MPHARPPERLLLHTLPTPIGPALLVTDEAGRLRAFDWQDYETRLRRLLRRHYGERDLAPAACPPALQQAIGRYFAGELAAIDDIACATAGTPFQRAVWQALRTIRPGRTVTYGALAAQLGQPQAARAVGLANGSNPIGVVVPCHRVVGADGTLTGYGGGLPRKRWLLAHEGVAMR